MKNSLFLKSNLLILIFSIQVIFANAQKNWTSIIDTNYSFWTSSIINVNDKVSFLNSTLNSNNGIRNIIFGTMESSNGLNIYTGNNLLNNAHLCYSSNFYSSSNLMQFNNFDSNFYCFGITYDSIAITYIPFLLKINSQGILKFAKYFGNINYSYSPANVQIIDSNTVAVSYSQLDSLGNFWGSRFGLTYFDTSGNIKFQDTFNATNLENVVNMDCDKNKNIYLCGYAKLKPFSEYQYQLIVKKTSSNGSLINSKYLPFNFNTFMGFVSCVNNVTEAIRLIIVNSEGKNIGFANQKDFNITNLRITYLDSNLDIYNTKIISTDHYLALSGVEQLKSGNLLLYGDMNPDTTGFISPYILYGWVMQIDTTGNIIWERKFNARNSSSQYIYDADEGKDGSIFLCGSVLGPGNVGQQALVIKLDSNGCLDTNFCYPMGIKEIKELEDNKIVVYPNPSTGSFNLELKSLELIGGQAAIYSSDGKLMQQLNNLQYKQNINVSNWASGVYFVSFSKDAWRKVLRMQVE